MAWNYPIRVRQLSALTDKLGMGRRFGLPFNMCSRFVFKHEYFVFVSSHGMGPRLCQCELGAPCNGQGGLGTLRGKN